jgi:hypothetical protein
LTEGNPFLVTEALAVDGDVPTDAVRDSTLARASRLRIVPERKLLVPAHLAKPPPTLRRCFAIATPSTLSWS